ncbi:hypothetical protein [Mangrovivirga cuniculi]|uniref:Cache domain-containing protein n=1 Tax=Mangrovivirga cuniculi TaxID=2715131 RepID=A0A4D7K706_9BACT|nr:hypothetical protein [Mangrovivirga cuniculi]QCK15168.1 hypothetical protein DCC35_10625 [Mangrovivirga cuniculi]
MKFSNRGWVILSTMILITLAFMYYFLIYTENKEKEIIKDNYRVLVQISENIHQLIDGVKRQAETKLYSEKVNDILQNKSDTSKFLSFYLDSIRINFDSLRVSFHKEKLSIKYLNRASDKNKSNRAIRVKKTEYDILKLSKMESSDSLIKYKNSISITTDSIKNRNSKELKNDTNAKADSENKEGQIPDIKYDQLFANDLIQRKDVFNFIVISKLNKVDNNNSLDIIYTNRKGVSFISFGDSLLNQGYQKEIYKVDLGAAQYVTFNTKIELEGGEVLYLTGFISQEKMRDMKRSVSVYFLTFAIIITVLILIGLPLIKLKVMSTFERLYRRDVTLTGFSLIFGPALFIIMIFFINSNFIHNKYEQRDALKRLNYKLEENLNEEINSAIIQAKSIDNRRDDLLEENKYRYDADSLLLEFNYQYFNAIFWTDIRANLLYLVSFESYENIYVPNLMHRKYVRGPLTDEGYLFKSNGNKATLESIRSVTDGNYEVGLGMKIEPKILKESKDTLNILTTVFNSAAVMNPVIPAGYGYAIFDKKGNTIFHSDITKNLNENFLMETDGKLSSYTLIQEEFFTVVSYYRNDHYIYLNPLKGFEDLYLVTFVSRDYISSPNSIALSSTFVVLLFYFITLAIIYYLVYYYFKTSNRLKQKIFAFNWLRPYMSDPLWFEKRYLSLIYLNIVSILFMIIFAQFVNEGGFILINIFFISIICIITYFFVLSDNMPYQKKLYSGFLKHNTKKLIGK